MSASLIRRGLDLLNDDIKETCKGKGKRGNLKTPSKANVMDLVSTKRQGVSKQVKRLQGRLGPGKNKATVKDKRIKSAVDEFRKKQRKSQMSTNLAYFLRTGYKATNSVTMKILKQNSGRQSRNCPVTQNKPPESKSFFTEDEFQQFQKEYFGKIVDEDK